MKRARQIRDRARCEILLDEPSVNVAFVQFGDTSHAYQIVLANRIGEDSTRLVVTTGGAKRRPALTKPVRGAKRVTCGGVEAPRPERFDGERDLFAELIRSTSISVGGAGLRNHIKLAIAHTQGAEK